MVRVTGLSYNHDKFERLIKFDINKLDFDVLRGIANDFPTLISMEIYGFVGNTEFRYYLNRQDNDEWIEEF